MNDLEGYNLYYVIHKRQRGFSKIIGGIVVDQCEMLNRKESIYTNNIQVDACFFQTEEAAEAYKAWIESKGIPDLEVRCFEVPYAADDGPQYGDDLEKI